MDTTVRLGPLRFSLRATIDHHGPSINSGRYTASINCCQNILLYRSHNYGVWNYWQPKLLSCICYTIWIDWHVIFGLKQEAGSLMAPMALAHPLHPIDNRSRTRRRNLWIGCVSSWWPLFPSGSSVLIYIYIYIYIYICICYMSYVIGRIYTYNRSVIQYWWSCTPSHSIWLYFWEVRSSWFECHFLFLWFTNCVLLSDDNSFIPGCLWLLVFVLNNTLIPAIWYSTIPHLPGCFVPGPSFRISDSPWCHRIALYHI